MFFDRETFGEDRLVRGFGELPSLEFFEKACLTERARRDLVRLYTEKKDLSAEEKRERLAKMSYQGSAHRAVQDLLRARGMI
jgi:hypothetical protein